MNDESVRFVRIATAVGVVVSLMVIGALVATIIWSGDFVRARRAMAVRAAEEQARIEAARAEEEEARAARDEERERAESERRAQEAVESQQGQSKAPPEASSEVSSESGVPEGVQEVVDATGTPEVAQEPVVAEGTAEAPAVTAAPAAEVPVTVAVESDGGTYVADVPSQVPASDMAPGDYNRYDVEWGDTLSGISSDTGASVDSIANANDIRDVDRIYAGSALRIPE